MKIAHIGYPKTGTTFLQKNIYPNLAGIKYFDYKTADKLFYETIYLDDLDIDLDKEKAKFSDYLKAKETCLFSFESLAGAPFIYKGANRSLIPKRLKYYGFERIIITIRNQTDMLDSMYRQYVVQGGVMNFTNFLNLNKKWPMSIHPFYDGYLDYDKLIKVYFDVFGKSNVLVLQQEDFKPKSDTIKAELIAFTGAEKFTQGLPQRSNESLTNLSIRLLRFCNHFIFTSQKPNNLIWNRINTWFVRRVFAVILDPFLFRFISSKRSYLDQQMKDWVKKRYSESNGRLKDMLEKNLDKKYFVE